MKDLVDMDRYFIFGVFKSKINEISIDIYFDAHCGVFFSVLWCTFVEKRFTIFGEIMSVSR